MADGEDSDLDPLEGSTSHLTLSEDRQGTADRESQISDADTEVSCVPSWMRYAWCWDMFFFCFFFFFHGLSLSLPLSLSQCLSHVV